MISESGASYSTWWNGGLRTTAYFHNMVGILTESFGSPTPTRVVQSSRRRLPYGDYPMPIATQRWHARQTIEYLQTSNRAILDYASRFKDELLGDFWRMGNNSIQRGRRDHWTATPRLAALDTRDRDVSPYADKSLRDARGYLVPRDQPDFAAATRLANALLDSGVEVQRVSRDFEHGGKKYRAGSLFVRGDQAFRGHVRDMFEPQWHPDDRSSGGEPVRPYDSAGWTLAMQLGVRFDRVYDNVEGPFEEIPDQAATLPGHVGDSKTGWLFSHANSNSFRAANRLLAGGERVFWLKKACKIGGREWPAGSCYVARGGGSKDRIKEVARELGVDFVGTDARPDSPALALRRPRIGLFDVWGGNMPTGWTQWILEQFEFPVELVFGERVTKGNLRKDFDVLLFCTGLPSMSQRPRGRRPRRRMSDEALAKLQKALPPFEDWSRIAERRTVLTSQNASGHLRDFVRQGGTLMGFGSQCSSLIRLFDLPVRVGTRIKSEDGRMRAANRSEFFIPGSLIRTVANESVLSWGVDKKLPVMFRRSPVFEIRSDVSEASAGRDVTVNAVLSYAEREQLASGWAIGEELLAGKAAVIEASVGNGRVLLYGPDVLYRGQPWATFKLVFNGLLSCNAKSVSKAE